MVIPVLVVDANIDDGKGIQKSLETTGHFQVPLATRAIEALMRFTETKFNVVVIDFGLPDLNGVDLIRQMHGIDESILVVAVLDEQESQASELDKLSVGVILDKHAYLTELPTTLSNFLNLPSKPSVPDLPPPDPVKLKPETTFKDDKQAETAPPELEKKSSEGKEVRTEHPIEVKDDPIPPWLQDPLRLKDYLSRLGKEHSAYAWLLSRGATPWNFSETITENQALGIVRLLSEHDEGLQSKGALIRYIRLSGTGNDYLLYATPVVSDINLTLIFSMETPFSVARRQSHKLSRLLIEQDPRKPTSQVGPPSTEMPIMTSQDDDEPLQPSDWIPGPKPPEKPVETHIQPDLMPAVEDIPQPDPIQAEPSSEMESDQVAMPVLEEMQVMGSARVTDEETTVPAEPDTEEMLITEEEPFVAAASVPEDVLVMESAQSTPVVQEEPIVQTMPVPEDIKSKQAAQPTPVQHEEQIVEKELSPTEPKGISEADLASAPPISSTPELVPLPTDWLPKNPKPASHLPFLDPLPSTPEKMKEPDPVNVALQEPKYFLPFTAILLPRFPNHKLVGSLANQLETWLNDLCIAWGWRMATIDIRPEFLRFTLYLSPDVAPAQSVQSLAQNLSTRILQAFSGLSDDLPSGQFWTKSYLLTAGSDVGKDRLATFIETTRKEQGLTS